MFIYLVRPISGCTFQEVTQGYKETANILLNHGYQVLHAMMGKEDLQQNDEVFKNHGYTHPVATDRAILGRDRWMVKKADIVFANFLGAKRVSIGSMMELAWAHDHGKHVVIAMEKDNIHRHAFVTGCADILFETQEEALNYLSRLTAQPTCKE